MIVDNIQKKMVFNSVRTSVDFTYRPGHLHRFGHQDPTMTSDRIMVGRNPGSGFGGTMYMHGNESNLPIPSLTKSSFDSIGKVWINLIEARRLLAADVNGTSDPYAILMSRSLFLHHTKIIYHSSNNHHEIL